MILAEILATKRDEVRVLKQAPAADLRQLEELAPARDFRAALRKKGRSIIAEVKRKSPSKGVLRENLDALALAGIYEQGGAAAISVLTDRRYFGGSVDDLREIRRVLSIPVLRKDFIIDPVQIAETRAIGADALLLIARILDRAQLRDFLEMSRGLGLAALVEVHDREDAEKAVESGAEIIGINNRDLATFRTDVRTTLDLLGCIPEGKIIVSESGIETPGQIDILEKAGVDAFLIGEALVRDADPAARLLELLGR